jgi:TonB family protein
MIGRFVCAVGCLVLIGAACGARQMPAPIVSTEMDALAAKLAGKIASDKVATVVVVGGASADGKISELGVSLRDGLNDALARQAAGIRVFAMGEVGAILTQSRVSTGMIYSDALAEWIAQRVHADAAVAIQFERVEDGRAVVTARIFDERIKEVFDKRTNTVVPFAEFEDQIALTEAQAASANRKYQRPVTTPVAEPGKDGISIPICESCPPPQYSAESRHSKPDGSIIFQVTIRPNGIPDDIFILRPFGRGMDGSALDAVLKWKFKPCVDRQKHPVTVVAQVEIAFQLN